MLLEDSRVQRARRRWGGARASRPGRGGGVACGGRGFRQAVRLPLLSSLPAREGLVGWNRFERVAVSLPDHSLAFPPVLFPPLEEENLPIFYDFQ
jgi:hypothetical protein